MPDLLAPIPGYKQPKELQLVDRSLSPIYPGDRVALLEDGGEHHGLYGIVQACGYADGVVKYDLRLFHPTDGPQESDDQVIRVTLEQLQ